MTTQGNADEPNPESNACSPDVATLTDSGKLPNSHLAAHRRYRSAENQLITPGATQSIGSENGKYSERLFVNNHLYSGASSPTRQHSTTLFNWHSKHRPKQQTSSRPHDTAQLRQGSSSHPSLACIDEDSDDDIGRTRKQSHQVTSRRSTKASSIVPKGPRRYVSNSFSSRNRQSNLQQQLSALPNASLQSLISSLTTSSGSSGNSTVTQKSYDKTAVRRRRATKRKRDSKDRTSGKIGTARSSRTLGHPTSGKMESTKAHKTEESMISENEEYQKEKSISRPASTTSCASRKDSILSPPTPSSRQHSTSSTRASSRSSVNTRWKRHDTFNSDSGISVTSSPEVQLLKKLQAGLRIDKSQEASDSSDESSDRENGLPNELVPTTRPPSATIGAFSPTKALPDTDPLVQRLQEQEEALKQHIVHSPQPKRALRPQVTSSYQPSPALPLYDPYATSVAPSTYPYSPPSPQVPHGDPMYFQSYYGMQDSQQLSRSEPPPQLDSQKTTIAGYELLAGKLSQVHSGCDQSIKPLYRKFEQLNHRVLLHLQDEIAELEEELRELDEYISQTSVTLPDRSRQPASRRVDARYGSELHFRRTQTLGKIFVKLQQYSKNIAFVYHIASANMGAPQMKA